MNNDQYQKLSGHYDEMYKNSGEVNIYKCDGWPKNRYEFAVCNSGMGERILDVGCGDGSMILSTSGCFKESVGVELSKSRLSVASKNCSQLNTKFYQIPFDQDFTKEQEEVFVEKFDTVICLDVVDHMVDVRKALENFYKALKPGGGWFLMSQMSPELKKGLTF